MEIKYTKDEIDGLYQNIQDLSIEAVPTGASGDIDSTFIILTYLHMGCYKEALSYINLCLSSDSENLMIWKYQAWCLRWLGDVDGAITAYRKYERLIIKHLDTVTDGELMERINWEHLDVYATTI